MASIIPPICPTCRVACVYEVSTPDIRTGIVMERNYCPSCEWSPTLDSGAPTSGAGDTPTET